MVKIPSGNLISLDLLMYDLIIMDSGQIILFQTQGGETKIEVRLSNETVWLTADQMAELFQRNKSTISRHIKNVFESGELDTK